MDSNDRNAFFRQLLYFSEVDLRVFDSRRPELSFITAHTPSSAKWDAPLFCEFCRTFGLVNATGSFSIAWRAMVSHANEVGLSLTNSMDSSSRSKMTSACIPASAESFFNMLDYIATRFQAEADIDPSHASDALINQIILPTAISVIDRQLTYPMLSEMQESDMKPAMSVLRMHELLRYGGERLIVALEANRSWMLTIYQDLLSSSCGSYDPAGPVLSHVCRYFTCRGLVKAKDVAVLAKRSLHPRMRPLPHPHAQISMTNSIETDSLAQELSVSIAELEEILLRVSHFVWIQSGAAVGRPLSSSFVSSGAGASKVIDNYCELCLYSLDAVFAMGTGANWLSSRGGTLEAGKLWGADYLTPFVKSLKTYARIPIVSTGGVGAAANHGRAAGGRGVFLLRPFVPSSDEPRTSTGLLSDGSRRRVANTSAGPFLAINDSSSEAASPGPGIISVNEQLEVHSRDFAGSSYEVEKLAIANRSGGTAIHNGSYLNSAVSNSWKDDKLKQRISASTNLYQMTRETPLEMNYVEDARLIANSPSFASEPDNPFPTPVKTFIGNVGVIARKDQLLTHILSTRGGHRPAVHRDALFPLDPRAVVNADKETSNPLLRSPLNARRRAEIRGGFESPASGRKRQRPLNKLQINVAADGFLEELKEALWPVFATYW